jgi:hypothetical protein
LGQQKTLVSFKLQGFFFFGIFDLHLFNLVKNRFTKALERQIFCNLGTQ